MFQLLKARMHFISSQNEPQNEKKKTKKHKITRWGNVNHSMKCERVWFGFRCDTYSAVQIQTDPAV